MGEIKLSLESAIEINRSVEKVYEWMANFPASLKHFPLMQNVKEVEKDKTYSFQIGPFGYKNFSTDISFKGTLTKEKGKCLFLESIPDSGNTEMRVQVNTEEVGPDKTKLSFTMSAASQQKIPKMAPMKMVNKMAEKSASVAINQGMKATRQAIEQETS